MDTIGWNSIVSIKKEKKKRKGKVGIFFISIFFMEDKLWFLNKNNKIIWEYPKIGWTWYFTLKKEEEEISIF